jgi:hypothetical protein
VRGSGGERGEQSTPPQPWKPLSAAAPCVFALSCAPHPSPSPLPTHTSCSDKQALECLRQAGWSVEGGIEVFYATGMQVMRVAALCRVCAVSVCCLVGVRWLRLPARGVLLWC